MGRAARSTRILYLEEVKFRAASKCYVISLVISYLPHDTRHIIQIPKKRLALLVMQILNAGGIEGDAGRTAATRLTRTRPPEQVKIEGTVRKAVAAAAFLRPCTEGRGGVEGSRELLIQQNTEGASERERAKASAAAVARWFLVLRPQKEKVEILLCGHFEAGREGTERRRKEERCAGVNWPP